MQEVTAPRTLKEKQRQEREELILKAAEEVLSEKGYYETSIDEIAARVGVAKGTVYLHFASKEDLVTAILESKFHVLFQMVEGILATEKDPRVKLENILLCMYADALSSHLQMFSVMNNSIELRRTFIEKMNCMRAFWEKLSHIITELLDRGKAEGLFDTTLPTPVMLNAFVSLLSPKSYERLVVQGHMSGEELARYLGHIYFKGIAAEKPQNSYAR